MIVGSGQQGIVELSPEAAVYLKRRRCPMELLPTPEVIDVWNEAKGRAMGLSRDLMSGLTASTSRRPLRMNASMWLAVYSDSGR